MPQQSFEIRELDKEHEWLEAFSVMKQLRTHLDEKSYLELVKAAAKKDNYRMAALFINKNIIAVAGFMPMITLYNGRFTWVCDLITDNNYRSKGYGEALLEYIQNWSKNNGYDIVSLSSGLKRIDAHRFYEKKMKYNKVSYVFLKEV
ncbi:MULTISPECIES: GNAT family N-acetyltransferase [Bacillaceae]|uniref:GNAT family N-acetyltransferase n=1 Tax=Bacillaceae TaxID=186817 RepID=UPI001E43938C|nr:MULTISPECIES: GNAT family N-acetyltransferase [Bacillaceae]MCE4051536.1 GNAT family N-acetyltransferase [Bacillus sp. Au-Bac7]MCM3031684.1 GNAT family N-acetyltransferase [Niallia sp. MER 6]UPO89797.1 GNAT family N-acetyltransferase [Niallia sp. Man26]